jgi:hypothetical protein
MLLGLRYCLDMPGLWLQTCLVVFYELSDLQSAFRLVSTRKQVSVVFGAVFTRHLDIGSCEC